MKEYVKKTVSSILAAALSLSMFAGCSSGTDKQAKVLQTGEELEADPKPSLENYDGLIVEDGGSYAFTDKIAFMSTETSTSTSASDEFEPITVDLTATVYPSDANQNVDWRVEFVDTTDEWTAGKNATDYVTITTSASGDTSAQVTCLNPFSSQIKVVCASQENPEIFAECTVDFIEAVKTFSVSFGDIDINFGGQTDVYWEVNENGVGYGGVYTETIETYPDYTIAADHKLYCNLLSPAVYLEGVRNTSWGGLTWGMAAKDGYFVLNGVDMSILSGEVLWSTNSTKGNRYRDITGEKLLLNNYDLGQWTKYYESSGSENNASLIDYFGDVTALASASIDNGYLWTFEAVVYVVQTDGTVVTDSWGIEDSHKSLINLVGFTNNPVVQSITLGSTSLQF